MSTESSAATLAAIPNTSDSVAAPRLEASRQSATPPKHRPGDPPTRERKLKAITYEQVDAARSLIKPQPFPQRKANKIVFEADHTPADAEWQIGFAKAVGPVNKKKPGPTPKTAPAVLQAQQAEIQAARAAITPRAASIPIAPITTALTENAGDANATAGPVLIDAEMEQIVQLVQARYGPILDITQAAEVSKLAKQTIRERVCHGMYASSVVRGRPLRFWSHRFVKEAMGQ